MHVKLDTSKTYFITATNADSNFTIFATAVNISNHIHLADKMTQKTLNYAANEKLGSRGKKYRLRSRTELMALRICCRTLLLILISSI